QVDDEYRRSWAVVAPFINGSSGVKTKIAEALSFGRPVATTSIGVDPGHSDQFGDAVVVADDPHAFAANLLDIMLDEPARHARPRAGGRRFPPPLQPRGGLWPNPRSDQPGRRQTQARRDRTVDTPVTAETAGSASLFIPRVGAESLHRQWLPKPGGFDV